MTKLPKPFVLSRQDRLHGLIEPGASCQSNRLTYDWGAGPAVLFHVEVCGEEISTIWGFPENSLAAWLASEGVADDLLDAAIEVFSSLRNGRVKPVAHTGKGTPSERISYQLQDNDHYVEGLEESVKQLIEQLRSLDAERTRGIGLHCTHN